MPAPRRLPSFRLLPLAALLVFSGPARAEEMPAADRAAFDPLVARTDAAWDSSKGGWVDGEGVPSTGAVTLAFTFDDDAWKARALSTADWMMATLRDTVGGGYLNSARDSESHSGAMKKSTD